MGSQDDQFELGTEHILINSSTSSCSARPSSNANAVRRNGEVSVRTCKRLRSCQANRVNERHANQTSVDLPAPTLIKYWLAGNCCSRSRYLKNAFKLPRKCDTCFTATNEKTVVLPFGPLYKFHLMPAIVVEATGVALPSEPYVPIQQTKSVY